MSAAVRCPCATCAKCPTCGLIVLSKLGELLGAGPVVAEALAVASVHGTIEQGQAYVERMCKRHRAMFDDCAAYVAKHQNPQHVESKDKPS